MSKPKNRSEKGPSAPSQAPAPKPTAKSYAPAAVPGPAVPTAALFRGLDWWAMVLTTVVVMVGYMLSLAPNVTLEDSGELSVGSHYAGIPHPPGYPVWTIYTWLFVKLLPVGNIAWRVGVASAFAGALSCGLIAMMVSRGGSMMVEGIADLRNLDKRIENVLCLVTGLVAGMMMGFNGYYWSQAVIVEVYTLSVLSLALVMIFLLHWIYTPSRMHYLYWATFVFGICFTNHQTLLVAAMGIVVLTAAVNRAIGRDVFLGCALIWVLALVGKATGKLTTFDGNPPLFVVFNGLGLFFMVGFLYLWGQTKEVLTRWKVPVIMLVAWVAGAAFYFWMPISSMTNPPLNWGYPRTVEGFWHALQRGQYEKANPANIFNDPMRFLGQIWYYIEGANEEFNPIFLLLAILPWLYYRRLQVREKAWMAGLFVIYLGLALVLLILLNPSPDRQSKELNKVFFTASHVMITMWIGYGLTILGGYLVLQYETYRRRVLIGGVIATGIALYVQVKTFSDSHLWLDHYAAVFLIGLTGAFTLALAVSRQRAPIYALTALMALMPAWSITTHWWDNEQRGHLFGYWFGHDMFTPPFKGKDGQPLYPEMDRDTVLFGGTDPGRFNPTYMIYNESFIPERCRQDEDPKFDRRDVYLITQNALADATYLMYIRAHYNRSAQIDPPFFTEFFKTPLLRPLDTLFLGIGDSVEKSRRTGASRLVPADLKDAKGLAARLTAADRDPLSKWLFDNVTPRTQELLKGGDEAALRKALAADLDGLLERELKDRSNPDFASTPRPLYETNRFAHVKLSERTLRFVRQNPQSHTRIRLNRQLLEEAYPKEIAPSAGGVYPDLEILTPTVEDSQAAFQEYITDAQRRLDHDRRLPNEPRQLKPGEDVRIDNGRVQVSGQIAVMAINGLLTKVIFDKNPAHAFYVEESFPLDWMFPNLTPAGVIMKINRQQLPVLTDDICQRDHEFWSQYSDRLIGNWVTYDTPIKEVCAFAERVYLHKDLRGFKGDPRFVRDDNAQKAFSKLRSAIGGIYAWRLGLSAGVPTPPQFMPKTQAERDRMVREADFAFKQAFAYCPFSPEALFRYVNLLVSTGRGAEAYLLAETCKKLDPENGAVQNLMQNLQQFRGDSPDEKAWRADPNNFQAGFKFASSLMQQGKRKEATDMLDSMAANPKADASVVLNVAQAFLQMQDFPRVEFAMKRMTELMPGSPEAWFDLTAVQGMIGKNQEAVKSLEKVVEFNAARLAREADRRAKDPAAKPDPAAKDMLNMVRNDPRLNGLRALPEYAKLVPPAPPGSNPPLILRPTNPAPVPVPAPPRK